MTPKIPTPEQMRERFEFQKDLMLEEDTLRERFQHEVECLLSEVADHLALSFSQPDHGYVLKTAKIFDDVSVRLANETLFGNGWRLQYCGLDKKQLLLLPLSGW